MENDPNRKTLAVHYSDGWNDHILGEPFDPPSGEYAYSAYQRGWDSAKAAHPVGYAT